MFLQRHASIPYIANTVSQHRLALSRVNRASVFLCLVFALSALLSGGGCSAVREISDAAQQVEQQAQGAREDLTAATETGEVGPQAQTHLDNADDKLVAIQGKARKVIRVLPGVTDATPWWEPVVKWGLIVGGILGALALCIYLNVGAIARPAFGLFGGLLSKLIPASTSARADIDAQAVVDGKATPIMREGIAASRASNPQYDIAFKAAKAKRQAKAVKR